MSVGFLTNCISAAKFSEKYKYKFEFIECLTISNLQVAKVIEKTPEGSLCVHLWDTSTDSWSSVNKQLVERGFAESLHPLPDELTTDCGTLASSSFQLHTD